MANEINIDSYNCQEIGMAKGFIDNGVNCDVLFYSKSNSEKYIIYKGSKITIYYRKAKTYFKIHGFFEDINDLLDKYDFFQLNEVTQIQNLYIFSKFPKKSYFYHGPYKNRHESTLHSIFNLFFENYIKIFMHLYSSSKPLIYVKSELAKDYLSSLGMSSKVVGVGLDFSCLGLPIVRNNRKNELLYVGKLEERRNIIFIIDLLSKLVTINPSYMLTVIGSGNSVYCEKINKRINELHLQDHIRIIGTVGQKELVGYYSNADLLLLPTNYEIFGMVILEALYEGVPVLTTYNGGSSVIKKGIIVRDLDFEKWIKAIDDFFSGKITESNKDISEYVTNQFSWSSIVKLIINDLNNIS